MEEVSGFPKFAVFSDTLKHLCQDYTANTNVFSLFNESFQSLDMRQRAR
jgi:hypothetical protein